MDSSSNDHGRAPPKESSSEQSSSNTDSSPPHPPPTVPPNIMYYPPGPGYPPPPQPYHPYPPQPGYAPYPNEYPPPHGYNNYPNAPYYDTTQNYRNANGGRGFIRGFIMCSCILFTTFFVATLVMALMLHPQLPLYKVSSVTVSNFNTNTTLTGDWDINITVQNPNDRLQGYFSTFTVNVMHQNDVVAASYVPDFVLEKKEEKLMNVKASSSNIVNKVLFQKYDLDKIATEQKAGSITFAVRVSSMTAFKSTSLSTRSSMMLAICEGVKVVFQNNTGTGTLDNGGKPVECQLYI